MHCYYHCNQYQKKNLPKKTAHDAGKRPHLDENNTTDRPKYNDRQDTNRVVDTYATVYSFSCSIIDMRFIGNGGGGSGSNVEIDRVTDFFRSNRTALEFARAVYRALTTNTAMRLSEIERCIGIGIGMKTDKSRVLFEELFCKNKHRCRFGAGCANCMLHAQWVYEFVYGSREPKFLCAYWDDEQACFEDVNEIAAWIKRDNEEEQKNIDSDTDEAVTATGCSFIVVSKSPLRPRDLEKESRDWTACDDDNPHGFSVRMFSRCNLHCCK